ncbi:MAG: DUF3592 domain-containing protein [Ramlibacter sp.]
MELTIADGVNTSPTAADLSAALSATQFPDDWCLTIDDGNDVMIDAEYDPVGDFRVSVWENDVRRHAVKNLDAGMLGAMLQKFLVQDASWRDLCQWESPEEQKARWKAEVAARKAELASGFAAPRPPTTTGSAIASFASLAIVVFGGYCAFKLATQGLGFVTQGFPRAEAKLAVLTGGMGLTALLMAIAGYRRFTEAQSWPRAIGKVIVSKVGRHEDSTGGTRGRRLHRPVIEFAYRVNGKDYRSGQHQLGTTTGGSESWARSINAKYPVGAAVEVRYNPANPDDAALESPFGIVWMVLAASVSCLAVCVYALHASG